MHDLHAWEKSSGAKLGGACTVAKSADGHLEYHHGQTLDLGGGLKFGLIAGAVLGGLIMIPLGIVAGAAGAAGIATDTSASGMVAGTAAGLGVVGVSGGAAAGGVAGAAAGEASQMLWGFRAEDLERIGSHLDAGRAALLVLCEAEQTEAASAELTRLGGAVERYHLPGEALDHAQAALSAG